jgi:hypothetical protein
MKYLRLFFMLAGAACLVTSGLSAAQAVVGQPAPDFKFTAIDGQTYRISALKGKIVILEWINPECPFVRRHYESGNMPTLQKEAEAKGIVWISVNSGAKGAEGNYSPEDARAWLKKQLASPTAYYRDEDGKLGQLYGAKTTPDMYVINRAGILVYSGAIDDNRRTLDGAKNYVRAALVAVEAGQPVVKAKTEPYGCSVKY